MNPWSHDAVLAFLATFANDEPATKYYGTNINMIYALLDYGYIVRDGGLERRYRRRGEFYVTAKGWAELGQPERAALAALGDKS